ncbi:MAG: tRNA (adenosine(37)-N6)-threonylcarbamoyltransferase complex dimerization subunit type 1 TsaB [Pseudomonadota bacterium]
MNTKPILAFDCACVGASIALGVGKTVVTRSLPQSKQAAALVSTIDGLLRERGVAYTDLAAIVTTIGPGSFTGVRIGLAALHGFALVHPTPIKTLSTLEALAWQVATTHAADGPFLTVLRAGKGEVYAQPFTVRDGIPTASGEIFLAPEDHADWPAPTFGNHVPEGAPNHILTPDAAVMVRIAAHLPTATLASALPLYIRPPDAKIPTAPLWLSAN